MSSAFRDTYVPAGESFGPSANAPGTRSRRFPELEDAAITPQSDRFYARFGKRALDLLIVVMVAPIAIPLIAILSAIVALEIGRPLFAHNRLGQGGRSFGCLKIRTMFLDADARLMRLFLEHPEREAEWKANYKLTNDPRVTRIGRFLRRTSLDELPQLWNVLRGDMSLVGPRPVTEPEIVLYGRQAEAYFAVRPGLTGLWQVSGRNALSFYDRAKLDAHYVMTMGFRRDLGILARTLRVMANLSGR